MREALFSVLAQDYDGPIEAIIVFDKSEPDFSLVQGDSYRTVRVIRNVRTPGLAGARNSGILAATGDLVSFCDDDDSWTESKLSIQVGALIAEPESQFATTAMLVNYQGRTSPRLAGVGTVGYTDLLQSRMAMLHSSSFLVWRSALLHEIGLVDETLPKSMAEDWDLLLRAARSRSIVNVDQPLVNVRWGSTSYFADDWALKNEAQIWLMEHYPEMLKNRTAAGLCFGKLAFGEAAQRNRAAALQWAIRAFRTNWREPRTYVAIGVVLGILSPARVLQQLSKHGHGI